MSAGTPETDVIRKHRKEEIRDEEFKEQEIRIQGSGCPGSHNSWPGTMPLTSFAASGKSGPM